MCAASVVVAQLPCIALTVGQGFVAIAVVSHDGEEILEELLLLELQNLAQGPVIRIRGNHPGGLGLGRGCHTGQWIPADTAATVPVAQQ